MTVTASQLRQEIFALGGRHQGDPLNGAIHELKDHTLSWERRNLLRAVVAHLSDGASSQADVPDSAAVPTTRLLNAVYITVLAASVIWTMVSLRQLLG